MSHIEKVTVSRCGDWLADLCPGDEHGCTRCNDPSEPSGGFETLADYDLYCDKGRVDPDDWTEQQLRAWHDKPHPTEISHGQFLRDYGRCPQGCKVAEQLTIAARTPDPQEEGEQDG